MRIGTGTRRSSITIRTATTNTISMRTALTGTAPNRIRTLIFMSRWNTPTHTIQASIIDTTIEPTVAIRLGPIDTMHSDDVIGFE